MNMQQKKKQSGFTIIEVVLVLAIAGLIFLMVFIALPALQRNQRDVQRKNDLGRVKTALQGYMSSNRGDIPRTEAQKTSFKNRYLIPSSEYTDPQGGEYTLDLEDRSTTGPANLGQIIYVNGSTCGPDGTVVAGAQRDYAFLIKLESQSVPFCLDSK